MGNTLPTTTHKKTITVLGALGGQGGSVIDTFLKDGSFLVRGVTRSVDSDAAKALEQRGVEMVTGDTKDPSSLFKAFTGADIVFVVMNFLDPGIRTKEGTLTKEIFEQAKMAGVKHVIYSGLANVDKHSGGELKVPHFTLKAEAWDYLKSMNGFKSVTNVEAAAYYSNWFTFFKPKQEDDGTLVWTWPGKKGGAFSQFDVSTGMGPAVLAAAQHHMKYHKKEILLEGDKLSIEDCVALISKKTGKPVRVDYVHPEIFKTLFEGAAEVADMVTWFDLYGFYGPETKTRHHKSGKEIGGLISFEEWLDTEEFKKLSSPLLLSSSS
ncbi:hypothetical protein ACA910_002513 [Epithemia clementina (nom. ined.)]